MKTLLQIKLCSANVILIQLGGSAEVVPVLRVSRPLRVNPRHLLGDRRY